MQVTKLKWRFDEHKDGTGAQSAIILFTELEDTLM